MVIKIRLFAILREWKGQDEVEMEVEDGTTVAQLFDLMFPPSQRPGLRGSLLYAVNQAYCPAHTRLNPGDEVAFVPPVSGGIDLPLPHVALTYEPIDLMPLIQQVQHPSIGAVTTFQGLVRDHAEGQGVHQLHYEAFEEMALTQLKLVAEELREKWGLTRVVLVHRLGTLQLMDVAVVVVVGSAHREEGFAACRYAIDRLKETVPIWKKEFYSDDHAHWK